MIFLKTCLMSQKIFVLFSIHGFTEELIEYASDRENILLMQ